MVVVSPTDWRTYPRGRPTPPREPVSSVPASRLAQFLGIGSEHRRPGVAGWLIPRTVVGLSAWSLVLVSLVGVVVAFGFAASQARIAEREQKVLGQAKTEQSEFDAVPSPAPTASPSPVPTDPLTIVVGSAGRSVVAVEDFDDQGGVTAGTGFVLQATPTDLWVVTSYSIVRAAKAEGRSIKIRFPNFARLDGTVRTVDETRDLALIIVSGERLPGINRFAPPVTAAGTTAYALGVNATSGRVVGQEITITQVQPDGLLIDAPGVSAGAGGPIVDAEGALVGVLPVTYTPKGQEGGLWAVPAQQLCRRVVVCPAAVRETPSPSAGPAPSPD